MRHSLGILLVAVGAALAVLLPTGSGPADAVAARESSRAAAVSDSDRAEAPARTPTETEHRAWLRHARTAGPGDVADLRHVALHDADPLRAGNAVRALGRLGVVTADSEVARLLEDPRPRLRQEAVMALGESRDPAAVEILAQLVRPDEPLAPLAARSLGRLGLAYAEIELRRIASDTRLDTTARLFAEQALRGR